MAKAPRYDRLLADLDTSVAAGIVIEALVADTMRAAPAVLRGDDTRAVHDMRVSIRRLRSALATFGESFASKRLRLMRRSARHIGRKLGPVRDADVHLAVLRAALAGAPSVDRAGIAYAIETLTAMRSTALAAFAIELSQFDRDLFPGANDA